MARTLREDFAREFEATRDSGDPHVTLTFRSWNGAIAIGGGEDEGGEWSAVMFEPDEGGIEAALSELRGALEVVKDEALYERDLAGHEEA